MEAVIIVVLDNWNFKKGAFQVFFFFLKKKKKRKHERNGLKAFIKKLGYKFEEYYDQVQQDGSNADGPI